MTRLVEVAYGWVDLDEVAAITKYGIPDYPGHTYLEVYTKGGTRVEAKADSPGGRAILDWAERNAEQGRDGETE